MKTIESSLCPKCKSNDIVFSGNWTGVMVSDIYAEYFWLGKCNSCGFTFRSSLDEQPDPVDDKRNYV